MSRYNKSKTKTKRAKAKEEKDLEYESSRKSISVIKKIRHFLTFVVIIAIIGFLVINRKSINFDNFKRVIAKFDFAFKVSETTSENITFTPSKNNIYCLYKNGFTATTPDGLKIYDDNLNLLFNNKKGFSNAVTLKSDKYMLSYDFGDKDLVISNSFANVFEKKFDGAIEGAAINDKGYFAVSAKEAGYESVLRVYNNSFDEIYRWSISDKNVIALDVAENSKYAVVGAINTSLDKITSSLSLVNFNEEKPRYTINFENELIYRIYTSDNSTFVITDKGYYIVSNKGDIKKKEKFNTLSLKMVEEVSSKYIVMAFESGSADSKTKILAFDFNGEKIFEFDTKEIVYSISASNKYIALLYKDSVDVFLTLNFKLSENIKVNNAYRNILVDDFNKIYLISSNSVTTKLLK